MPEEDPETPDGDAPSAQAPPEAPPEPAYEEVTLADLVVTLWDHRVAAVAVLAVAVLVTAGWTAATPPAYEATATVLPVHEEATILAVLGSDRFAADAAERAGVLGDLPGGTRAAKGAALAERVTVQGTDDPRPGSDRHVLAITATAPDGDEAAAVANAYVATLQDDTWQELLEQVTYDRRWEGYLQATAVSGNNSTEPQPYNASLARQRLTAYVDELTYVHPLDQAQAPAAPASPSWSLNLALGTTLGLMLGFMTPFVLEAGANVRRELRERADGG